MTVRILQLRLRQLHLLFALCFTVWITWGLLSSNPLAAIEGPWARMIRSISDVFIHVGIYGTAAVILWPFARSHSVRWRWGLLLALLLHGVGTELLQLWIPARTCDPLDMLSNFVGTASGIQLSARLPKVWRWNTRSPGTEQPALP